MEKMDVSPVSSCYLFFKISSTKSDHIFNKTYTVLDGKHLQSCVQKTNDDYAASKSKL